MVTYYFETYIDCQYKHCGGSSWSRPGSQNRKMQLNCVSVIITFYRNPYRQLYEAYTNEYFQPDSNWSYTTESKSIQW